MVQLHPHLFSRDGFHQVAAGMQIKGRVPVFPETSGKHNIDFRLVQRHMLGQLHAVCPRHCHVQKGHIDVAFLRIRQGVLAPAKAVQLRFGSRLPDGAGQGFQGHFFIVYSNNCHASAPSFFGITITAVVPTPGVLVIVSFPPAICSSRKRTFSIPMCIFPSSM